MIPSSFPSAWVIPLLLSVTIAVFNIRILPPKSVNRSVRTEKPTLTTNYYTGKSPALASSKFEINVAIHSLTVRFLLAFFSPIHYNRNLNDC